MTTPGSSYDCPLVLDDSPTNNSSPIATTSPPLARRAATITRAAARARTNGGSTSITVVCLDESSSDDDDLDRKIAAKPSANERRRRRSGVNTATVASTTTLTSANNTTGTVSAVAAARISSEDDDDVQDEEKDGDEALAKRLQEEEWATPPQRRRRGQRERERNLLSERPSPRPDYVAWEYRREQEQYHLQKRRKRLAMQAAADANLAATLAKEEEAEKEERKKDEQVAMARSMDGRAWLFVNQVLDQHKQLSQSHNGLKTVAVDDMVFLGKNFLQCVADFEANHWPCTVTLAYHYTRSERMDTIKQDGLMTLADRRKMYKNSHGVGVFGDGIYTATNPFAFFGFGGGNVGLIVAVLLGNTQRVPYVSNPTANLARHINTVIGNKRLARLDGGPSEEIKYFDELVLQTSRQCLPLLQFDTSLVRTQAGMDAIWKFHQAIQGILDGFFNNGVRTNLKRIHPQSRHATVGGAASATITPRLAAATAARLAGQRVAGVPPPGNPVVPGASIPTVSLPGPVITRGAVPSAAGVTRIAVRTGTVSSAAGVTRIAVRTGTVLSAAGVTRIAVPRGVVPSAAGQPRPLPPTAASSAAAGLSQAANALAALAVSSVGLSQASMPTSARVPATATAAFSAAGATGTPTGRSRRTRMAGRRTRSRAVASAATNPVAPPEVVSYTMPARFLSSVPPDAFAKSNGSKEECAICMDPLSNPAQVVVRLRTCSHEFHRRCIRDALIRSPKCPVCRALISKPQGKSPSGIMSITTSSIRCGGFESCGGSIVMTYSMPSGTQMPYHDNPGVPYQGTTRVAYLPDNEDGQKLLKRLKFAWKQGLTFTIGTSLTTRQPNCITWASIHHKTSPSGGPHGFPDPGFFANANAELDTAGVPK